MRRAIYNIRQALQQIFRNKGMSLASVFAITAMMLILGLFFIISVNVNVFTEVVRQDYDQVEVYLDDNVTESSAEQIMNTFKQTDGVSEVKYRSKEQAMQIMKERWGENGSLLNSLDSNPLPNSILVKVDNLKAANNINAIAKRTTGVESTKYYKETVDKLTKVTSFLQIAMLVIMIFLVAVSVVVVSNTIKLTVFARAREISIMKYIGATNWFIRGPFLVEGIIIGIFSSLISSLALYAFYARVVDFMGVRVMTILSAPMVPAGYLASNLILIFLAVGIGIGSTGSIISMRKFLDK